MQVSALVDHKEVELIKELFCRLENEATVQGKKIEAHRINARKLHVIRQNSTSLSRRKIIASELEATTCDSNGIEDTVLKLNLKYVLWKRTNHCDPAYREALAREGKKFDQEANSCDGVLRMYEPR